MFKKIVLFKFEIRIRFKIRIKSEWFKILFSIVTKNFKHRFDRRFIHYRMEQFCLKLNRRQFNEEFFNHLFCTIFARDTNWVIFIRYWISRDHTTANLTIKCFVWSYVFHDFSSFHALIGLLWYLLNTLFTFFIYFFEKREKRFRRTFFPKQTYFLILIILVI